MARRGKARQGDAWHGGARQGVAWLGKAWQGSARPGEAGHGVAEQGAAIQGKANLIRQGVTKMRIAIRIQGKTPLICNRFTDEAAMAATSGTRGSSAGGDRGTPQEIAASKLYVDEQGKVGIPQPNLLRCLVDGGAYHKLGKRQITTAKSSLVYSCLDVVGTMLPLKYKQPWVVDTRPIVIPSTGGRILAYRPRFDDWEISFEIELDETVIGVKLLRSIIDDAGQKIGLGDFRPSKKGPYGRFVVTHWAEKTVQLRDAAE